MSLGRRNVASALLLAFVAVTALVFGVKELRHARAVASADAAAARPGAGRAAPSAPVGTEAPLPAVAVDPPAPVAPARRASARPATAVAPAAGRAAPAVESSTIVVSYFHTTARCASCLRIEELTASTVTGRFVVPLADRHLVWRVVNVDEPENAHYLKDYQLYTKSVVVSEVRGGKEVRWKNLDRVWTLLGQPEAFQEYVEKEVRSFLGPA